MKIFERNVLFALDYIIMKLSKFKLILWTWNKEVIKESPKSSLKDGMQQHNTDEKSATDWIDEDKPKLG